MITTLLKKIHIWLELASIVYRDNLLVQSILIIVQLHYSTESSCTQTSPLLQSVVSPIHQSSRTSSPHRIRKLVIDSGRWMLQTSKTSLIACCDPSTEPGPAEVLENKIAIIRTTSSQKISRKKFWTNLLQGLCLKNSFGLLSPVIFISAVINELKFI